MSTPKHAEQANEMKQHTREALHSVIAEQVMHTLGKSGILHRVQVRSLWGDFYRVNVLVGVDAASVKVVIEAQGELDSFHTLQKQPAWRGQSLDAQLRRFMGSGATRKIRYARLLIDAFDPAQVPRPLHLVLAHVLRFSHPGPGD